MKLSIFACLLLVSCYDNVDTTPRDTECEAVPDICEPDEKFNSCAEFGPSADNICEWTKCYETIGQRNEWVEIRRCLRYQCGVPFDEDCFETYRSFLIDCFDNDCSTEVDAWRCSNWNQESRSIC